MLTPRENFLRFMHDQPYERIPTSGDLLVFRPAFFPDNVARGMVAQQEKYAGALGGPDVFGVEWVFDPQANGSMEKAPLYDELEEWEDKLPFPDPDAFDWERQAAANRRYLDTDKLVSTTFFTGFFERLISFVGFEGAAMALIDEDSQESVHRLFSKLADYYVELGRRFHDFFGVEHIEVHDDWGTQRSPMFSADTHAEMIAPYIRRVADGFHQLGILYEQHSCGLIEPLIPNLIAAGCDTWKGQTLNDKKKLVDMYGDRFHFAVEVRPAGPLDDEESLAYVKNCLELYRGKKIWLALGRTFTPGQLERIHELILTYPTA